jgi:chromosome segregation ATPase
MTNVYLHINIHTNTHTHTHTHMHKHPQVKITDALNSARDDSDDDTLPTPQTCDQALDCLLAEFDRLRGNKERANSAIDFASEESSRLDQMNKKLDEEIATLRGCLEQEKTCRRFAEDCAVRGQMKDKEIHELKKQVDEYVAILKSRDGELDALRRQLLSRADLEENAREMHQAGHVVAELRKQLDHERAGIQTERENMAVKLRAADAIIADLHSKIDQISRVPEQHSPGRVVTERHLRVQYADDDHGYAQARDVEVGDGLGRAYDSTDKRALYAPRVREDVEKRGSDAGGRVAGIHSDKQEGTHVKQELDRLRFELDRARQQLETDRQEIIRQKQALIRERNDVDALKQDVDRERSELYVEMDRECHEVSKAKDDLDRERKQMYADLEREREALRKDIDRDKGHVRKHMREVEDAQERMQHERQFLETEILDKAVRLESDVIHKAKQLESDIDTLQAEVLRWKKDADNLREDAMQLRDTYEAKISRVEGENEALERDSADKSEEIGRLNVHIRTLNAQIDDLGGQIEELNACVGDMNSQLEALKTSVAVSEEEIAQGGQILQVTYECVCMFFLALFEEQIAQGGHILQVWRVHAYLNICESNISMCLRHLRCSMRLLF